jgi:hypothetical protein
MYCTLSSFFSRTPHFFGAGQCTLLVRQTANTTETAWTTSTKQNLCLTRYDGQKQRRLGCIHIPFCLSILGAYAVKATNYASDYTGNRPVRLVSVLRRRCGGLKHPGVPFNYYLLSLSNSDILNSVRFLKIILCFI